MTIERDTRTRIVLSWLREDAHENAERVLLRALDEVDATPQRHRLGAARRTLDMRAVRISLAAAAVVAVAMLGYRFVAAPIEPGVTTSPTAKPTPEAAIRVWDGPGALAPGAWAMDVGTIRVTFEVPAGWQENTVPDVIWTAGSDAHIGFGFVDNLYVDPCDTTAEREPPVGPSVDALATALANLPGIEATGPTGVALGGFAGKVIEFDLSGSASPCKGELPSLWHVSSNDEAAPLETGAQTRVHILDVEGQRLVVTTVDRHPLSPLQVAELQAILDSIEIEP
jgi:hypothetical protein